MPASLKRKELEPTPPPTPKRQQRENSFITIASDGDEPAPYYFYETQPASPDEDVPAARIDSSPALCQEQQALVDLIMSGNNVFFTGSAGCGKSTVLKVAIRQLEAQGRKVNVLAPTGIAALNVGGMTIHSYMGWQPQSNAWSLEGLKRSMQKSREGSNSKNQTATRIRKTDVLVIDEISMVENNLLSRMEACIRHVRQMYDGDVPWGNLQLIVTGDFCQLPPVKPFTHCWLCGDARTPFRKTDARRGRQWDSPRPWPVDAQGRMKCNNGHGPWTEQDKWAFRSPAWRSANFACINLRQIHRQNDRTFIEILQKCRLGLPFTDRDFKTLFSHPTDPELDETAVQLYSLREEATEKNRQKFNEMIHCLPTEYQCLDGWEGWQGNGAPPIFPNGTLKKFEKHRFDQTVRLKESQLIVLQVNLAPDKGLVNGSQGYIVDWEPIDPGHVPVADGPNKELREREIYGFTDEYIHAHPDQNYQVWPVVQFNNGYRKTIVPVCDVQKFDDSSRAFITRTQIPLLPGWALTIHKSQGMTLNRVIINLNRSFEAGQAYVALSRATNLKGLKIGRGNRGDLSIGVGGNPEVRQFLTQHFGNLMHNAV